MTILNHLILNKVNITHLSSTINQPKERSLLIIRALQLLDGICTVSPIRIMVKHMTIEITVTNLESPIASFQEWEYDIKNDSIKVGMPYRADEYIKQ